MSEPRVVAAADQQLAHLRDLVESASRHADKCPETIPCPGRGTVDQLRELSPQRTMVLLAVAVAELAALGYGKPAADRYDLTDDGWRAGDAGQDAAPPAEGRE